MSPRTARAGRAVKIAIGGLHQRGLRLRAVIKAVEARERGDLAAGSDSEQRAVAARAAAEGRPVKIPIAALNQSRVGIRAVREIKRIQRGQCPAHCDSEY